jgi:hypothetical protein
MRHSLCANDGTIAAPFPVLLGALRLVVRFLLLVRTREKREESAMSLIRLVVAVGVVFSFLAIADSAFAARRELVLHTFSSGSFGYWPYANLIFDAAGNL